MQDEEHFPQVTTDESAAATDTGAFLKVSFVVLGACVHIFSRHIEPRSSNISKSAEVLLSHHVVLS